MQGIEFVILIGVLIWIGLRIEPANTNGLMAHGWKYTIVNISGHDDYDGVENRLNEIGRWGRELVVIWLPPEGDPKRDIYAIFKEKIRYGEPKTP